MRRPQPGRLKSLFYSGKRVYVPGSYPKLPMHRRQGPAVEVGTPTRPTPVDPAGDGTPQFGPHLPHTARPPPDAVSPTLRRVVRSSTRSLDNRPLPTVGTVNTDETGATTSRPRQNRLSTVIHIPSPSRCERPHPTANWTTFDPRNPRETPARCRCDPELLSPTPGDCDRDSTAGRWHGLCPVGSRAPEHQSGAWLRYEPPADCPPPLTPLPTPPLPTSSHGCPRLSPPSTAQPVGGARRVSRGL